MHNSRTSQRKINYKVLKGPARRLSTSEEIILTRIIGDIIVENGYRFIAFNSCQDHVHMIIVCHVMELTRIVQKIKSISSKLFHRHEQVCPIITSVHHKRLWSQKFFRAQ